MGGRLNGKKAIVTGAGDGIGRGIAASFSREGAAVAICDINPETVAETRRRIEEERGRVIAAELDVTRSDSVKAFVDRVSGEFGGIDVLVNNAAVLPVAPIETQDEDEMERKIAVNLMAPIVLSKYCIPHMRTAGGGSIINMANVTGHNGHPGVSVYGATKGALMALARGLAMEVAADGIRVNTVSPGTVDSPMLHNFILENADDTAAAREAFDALHPIGRIGTIDEVANLFVFLASDDSSNITATDIRCDGGYCVQGQQPRN